MNEKLKEELKEAFIKEFILKIIPDNDYDATKTQLLIDSWRLNLSIYSKWWLIKLDEAYEEAYEFIGQQYQVKILKEVENILQKELETWKKESVGWKAVESIILAIKEYKQYKLNKEIEEEFEKFCIKGFVKEIK